MGLFVSVSVCLRCGSLKLEGAYGRLSMPWHDMEICSRWANNRGMVETRLFKPVVQGNFLVVSSDREHAGGNAMGVPLFLGLEVGCLSWHVDSDKITSI